MYSEQINDLLENYQNNCHPATLHNIRMEVYSREPIRILQGHRFLTLHHVTLSFAKISVKLQQHSLKVKK